MISSVLPCQRIVKAISFFVCLFAINFAAAQTATITTDQPDYPPGSTVILMGSGFAAGDTVRLQVLHVGDGDNETSGAHAPWIVVADDNGNFTTTWIVPPDEDELGATLLTTADGQTSGLHAETTFTDALRTDTYPSAFSTFTGGNSYCLNATTSNLTANWTNTVCNGTLNGNNTNVGITITWFKNTANSTTGGTQVQQTTTNAGTTSSTFTPSSAVAGTVYYYVTVSWSAGPNCAPSGSITSGTQAVTINPLPTNKTPVAAQSSVCSGSSTTIQIASSEAGVDYQLRNNAGNINVGAAVSGNGGIIDLPTGNLTANTTFNVLAKNATTTCSVQLTPTVTVTVNPLPNNASNSFSSNTICNGDAGLLGFDAIDGSFVAPYSIQYTDGITTWTQSIPSAAATTFNVAVNPTVTTTYTLVSITNGNGCTTTTGFGDATAQIIVRPTPSTSIGGGTTVCRGGSSPNVTFTNPQSLPVTVTYNINGGGPLTLNIAANSTANVNAPTGTAGTFNYNLVSVAYQTAPNCSNNISGTATVVVRPTPTATIGGTSAVCLNGSSPAVTFTNPQLLDERITYNINGGANTTIDVLANSFSTVAVPTSAAGTFDYNLVSVVYLDGTPGCSNNISGKATITVRATPTATMTINGANPICSGSTTSIKFTGPSMGVVTYNIDEGSPITDNLNNGGVFVLTTAALTSNTTYNLVSVAYGDNPGCSASASGSVLVTVNQPPVITQPADIPVATDPNLCSAVVTYDINATGTEPINYTYSFDGATSGSGSGTGSGSTFSKGTTTVTITANNGCTPNDTKSFTVTVTDNQGPTITTGVIASCYKTVGDAEAAAIAATSATDNCPGTITYSASTSGSCDALITVTATDASNNSNTTTYSTKILTTAPVVPTDGSKSVECLSAATTPAPPEVTDACGAAVSADLTSTVDSPDLLTCEGTRTYTYTYTDCAGNSSVWKYVYTIKHVTHPEVPSDGSSIVSCAAQATAPGAPSGVKDVCGNALDGVLVNTTDALTCNGSITYTYRFTDCAGVNTDWHYTYNIVYSDGLEAPANGESTVSCPSQSQVAPATTDITDACGRTVHAVLVDHDAAPACNGDVVWRYTYTACDGTTTANWKYTYHVIYSGGLTAPANGESTVSCPSQSQVAPATADITDACGRTVHAVLVDHDDEPACNGDVEWRYRYTACDGTSMAAWTYTYHVVRNDFIIPETTNSSTVACAASAISTTVTLPTVKSGCGETLTPSTPVQGGTYDGCQGTITYTWTYADCAGHHHDWTYTYNVVRNDFTIPTTFDNSTVACLANATSTGVTLPVVKSDCGETLNPSAPVQGGTYNGCQGTITYSWTYQDCAGHQHSWTYTYTIVRKDFVMPGNQGSAVQCLSDAILPGNPSVNDNCGNAITPTGPVINTLFNGCSGTRTYTWTYKDCAGNSHDWIYTYTIADNIKPTISDLKTNATRLLDFNETTYTVQNIEFNETATDNCSLSSMIYTLSGATTGGGTSTSTSLTGIKLNGGITTVAWTATDACGNTKTCSFNVTVNKRPTTIVYTGDLSKQYSDQGSLTARLTDQTTGQPINGRTVTFTIGAQSASASAPSNGTDGNGIATTTLILTQDPALLNLAVATNFAGDATYLASYDRDNFDITEEDACSNYSGDLFLNTGSSTTTAVVNLKLALTDKSDGFRGDISKAAVTFTVKDNGNLVGTYNAPFVAGSLSADKTLAWFAVVPFALDIGNNLSKTYDITWTISGYYQGDLTCSDASAEMTISVPTSDFITGGGYVILDNTATGKYVGDPNSKNNFGFSVKWNKSLSNIQGGGINSIVRKGTHQYQIKGTKVTALSVTPANGTTPATAAFTCNAVVNDIVNNVIISSEGNCTAIVEITDLCEPGSGMPSSSDLIAITVKDKNGVVIYSNYWNSVSKKTDKVVLNGGNLQIHSGTAAGAPKCFVTGTRVDLTAREAESTIATKEFGVKAFPNPSEGQFTLKIESNNTKDKISMRVTDMFGRTIQTFTNLSAGQTLRIGSTYKVGIYFIDMRQGSMHKQLKLIKQ